MTDAAFLEPSLHANDAGATPADVHHLGWLESEAIHILREVAGQCHNPALLFSGGKDSLVLLCLAEKAFRPGPFPFPLLHIDTGHNFPEVIAFRDRRAAELGERLIVRSVEDSIARGRVLLARAPRGARDLSRASAPGRAPWRAARRRDRAHPAARWRDDRGNLRSVPHGRRYYLHRSGRLRGSYARCDHRRNGDDDDHRTR